MTLNELEEKLRAVLMRRSDIRFAMLFGSAVRGPDTARDIDVAVSFDAPLPLMELGTLAAELEAVIGKSVDVVDVEEASTLMRWEIVHGGRVVVARDENHMRNFLALVPLEYADLKPYYDREAEGLRRALGVD